MNDKKARVMKGHLILGLAIFTIITGAAYGQIRFRLRPFLGIGLRTAQGGTLHSIPIEDALDQIYYDWNLASPGKNFLSVQARINILEVWNFSLGYLFWGQHFTYSSKSFEDIVKIGYEYPNSYNLSLHGVALQWDLKFRWISSRFIIPYIMAGGGRFYGNFNNYLYSGQDWDGTQYLRFIKEVSMVDTYEGWAYFFGIGARIFKYAYFYIGYTDFQQNTLPSRQFIDVILGVTI